jgi:glycosyltransferase involved in cell wall biosynthesis
MTCELHIVIPTYNRHDQLLNCLQGLVAQIQYGVQITVLDNASPVPSRAYCLERDQALATSEEAGTLTFVRHRSNIGMAANLLRAFEVCQGQWLWVVSDDDDVFPDAVQSILKLIRTLATHSDVAFVKFNRGNENPAGGAFLRTLSELIERVAQSTAIFNSYIFITNGLYNCRAFSDQLLVGYKHLHTYVPHLMMLLSHMDKHRGRETVFLSDFAVASYVKPAMGYSYGLVAGLGVGAFKNFTFDLTRREYEALDSAFAAHNDYKVALDLFYYCQATSNMYVARRLVQNYYLLIRHARSLSIRLLFRAFLLLFYFPGLLDQLVRLLPMLSAKAGSHVEEIRLRNRDKSAAESS